MIIFINDSVQNLVKLDVCGACAKHACDLAKTCMGRRTNQKPSLAAQVQRGPPRPAPPRQWPPECCHGNPTTQYMTQQVLPRYDRRAPEGHEGIVRVRQSRRRPDHRTNPTGPRQAAASPLGCPSVRPSVRPTVPVLPPPAAAHCYR